MKHKGSNFEYYEELCLNLFYAFRKAFAVNNHHVYEETVMLPSPRFWVSSSRAAIVIREMLRGRSVDDMQPCKRDMYKEIHKRVVRAIEDGDERSVTEIVEDVVCQPAPHFYVTPGTAREKIKQGRRLWREKNPLFVPKR